MGARFCPCVWGCFFGETFFLVGLCGGGEWPPMVGVCVTTMFGCHSVPCGSYAAATILCALWSHVFVENLVLMPSIRQPLFQRDEGSR